MSLILLDTHVLVWLVEENAALGRKARAAADAALAGDRLAVSAITYWEIALLEKKGRVEMSLPLAAWRRAVSDLGVAELPITGDICISSVGLDPLHPDPADRLIVATAIKHDAVLITADDRLLAWRGEAGRLDART